jgi:SET domain-containing protein
VYILGLFSSRNLAARAHIIDYIGIVDGHDTASETSNFSLVLDSRLGLSIDAEKAGNEARMINDFRGVPNSSSIREQYNAPISTVNRPTVAFELYRHAKTGKVRMGVFAMHRRISKGDELLVSYGKGFWKE